MADESAENPTPLLLSNGEKDVLELHDRLQELQLEIALLAAQNNYILDRATSTRGDNIEAAQKALLDSRSRYVLRNEVVQSVIVANPILQAIHNGTKASPVERDLLPKLEQRDQSSSTLSQQSTDLRSLLDETMEVESESLRLGRENVALAAHLLDLAAQTDRNKADAVNTDPEWAAEISRLEDQVKLSRQRRRVLKETASAVVMGSGVDWSRDAELRGIVLDPGDDDKI
ncbi:centromere protein H (CENP-H)-domain-containing protein [Hypoxylon sp. FL1150]|nr:centromere protein H (CENP-H)-domain-containing protein [Hypoxylon sp. FL1150]